MKKEVGFSFWFFDKAKLIFFFVCKNKIIPSVRFNCIHTNSMTCRQICLEDEKIIKPALYHFNQFEIVLPKAYHAVLKEKALHFPINRRRGLKSVILFMFGLVKKVGRPA